MHTSHLIAILNSFPRQDTMDGKLFSFLLGLTEDEEQFLMALYKDKKLSFPLLERMSGLKKESFTVFRDFMQEVATEEEKSYLLRSNIVRKPKEWYWLLEGLENRLQNKLNTTYYLQLFTSPFLLKHLDVWETFYASFAQKEISKEMMELFGSRKEKMAPLYLSKMFALYQNTFFSPSFADHIATLFLHENWKKGTNHELRGFTDILFQTIDTYRFTHEEKDPLWEMRVEEAFAHLLNAGNFIENEEAFLSSLPVVTKYVLTKENDEVFPSLLAILTDPKYRESRDPDLYTRVTDTLLHVDEDVYPLYVHLLENHPSSERETIQTIRFFDQHYSVEDAKYYQALALKEELHYFPTQRNEVLKAFYESKLLDSRKSFAELCDRRELLINPKRFRFTLEVLKNETNPSQVLLLTSFLKSRSWDRFPDKLEEAYTVLKSYLKDDEMTTSDKEMLASTLCYEGLLERKECYAYFIKQLSFANRKDLLYPYVCLASTDSILEDPLLWKEAIDLLLSSSISQKDKSAAMDFITMLSWGMEEADCKLIDLVQTLPWTPEQLSTYLTYSDDQSVDQETIVSKKALIKSAFQTLQKKKNKNEE